MNIEVEDRVFLPDKTDGTPVPNERQAYHLDRQMEECLGNVVRDLDRQPVEYLSRFEAFAGTLKGAWAATLLTVGAGDLAIVTQSRKRAQRYVGKISDKEIRKHFDLGFSVEGLRKQLLSAACGVEPPNFAYSYTRHNVLLKNALEFGKSLPAYQFIKPEEIEEPPDPMPEGMVSYYNATPGVNRRKKSLKEAAAEFSGAYHNVRTNVTQSDRLFSRRFYLMWELVDAKARHEALSATLTKPLENYVCLWNGYRWRGNIEYKHKGAQAAWVAELDVKRTEELLQDNEALINNPGWSISTLIREAWDKLQIFKIILDNEDRKYAVKNESDRRKQAKREETYTQRKKLAEKPILISAVETEDGLWIDHMALIKGLKGRSNVTKSVGRSYIEINDTVIETAKLRRWLSLVLQDPYTGKRIPKNKWGQENWAHIGAVQADRQSPNNLHETEKNRSLYFSIQTGKMRISTTFYDQAEDLEGYNGSNRNPVLNHVTFDTVDAAIPEHRGVWTPENINEYHPVLARA